MTRQEILNKIASYEKALGNKDLPESTKENMRKKISQLQEDASKLEEKITKEEEKVVKEEKKIASDTKTAIEKYKKALGNKDLPDSTKENMRKKIAQLEKEIDEQQKEIKEEKKEIKEEKKEVKEAIKELKEKEKKVRKAPIKKEGKEPKVKAPKVRKTKEKEREVKQEKRVKKIKMMMSELEKLVEKNKALKEKYKGKQVDLEKDSKRSAKPFGYRFIGKHDYRIPKEVLSEKQFKNAKKRGIIDYEGRPNRSDKYPKGYKGQYNPSKVEAKLEHGGMAKGGKIQVGDNVKVNLEKRAKRMGLEIHNNANAVSQNRLKEMGVTENAKVLKIIDDDKIKSGAYTGKYEIEYKHKNKYTIDYINPNEIISHSKGMAEGGEMAHGGGVHSRAKDAQRFAKPQGWRWKNEALTDGIIKKASLSKSPSEKMRKEYPDYVAFENRGSKSDKHPSRKNQSL